MDERFVVKTRATFDDGTVESIDTIRHENKLWLVPVWLVQPALRQKQPLRIVRMDSLCHQAWKDQDFVLIDKLPKAIFDFEYEPQKEEMLEVQARPEIWFEHHEQ